MKHQPAPLQNIPVIWDEAEMSDLGNKNHQHKYTVPVEWEETLAQDAYFNSIGEMRPSRPAIKIVTRLRCESCPDEISREKQLETEGGRE